MPAATTEDKNAGTVPGVDTCKAIIGAGCDTGLVSDAVAGISTERLTSTELTRIGAEPTTDTEAV